MRYVISEGWSHIFSLGERDTRWVYDRETERLVHLQIFYGVGGFRSAPSEAYPDVEDSLKNANPEALDHPEEEGLQVSDTLPAWAYA